MSSSAIRGLGGVFCGVAAAMIASHLGMPSWQVGMVTALIAGGLPMAISGKWKDW